MGNSHWISSATLSAAVLAIASGASGQCDPVQSGHLFASDPGVGDCFGGAVALDGDTAIVGSALDANANGEDAGSAYVFVRAAGVWTQRAKLLAPDKGWYGYFGAAVTLRGDTAVVGAPGADTAGGLDAGSVYVFVRDAGVWNLHATLAASDAKPGDNFGWAVAFDGQTLVVGASRADAVDKLDAGAAYVFVRDGNVWSEQAKVLALDAAGGDRFGSCVGIDATTAVIAALNAGAPDAPKAGAAYVFVRDAGGWAQRAKLTASDGASADYFGFSLGLAGDTAIIGAPYADAAAGNESGRAYAFSRAGGAWEQIAALAASSAEPGACFGWSIAIDDAAAVIGAPFAHGSGGVQAGAAYVFTRAGGAWAERATIEASDGAPSDQFGSSAAIDGGAALLGAIYDDPSGKDNSGSAYVFDLNCAACYPDCDQSGELDIDDFICFQTLFALGDSGADCDGSGELDIDDFICFQTAFGVGCP